jgi:peptidoglycan/LPS O-acetylase OafA/YrhL
MGYRAHLDGLRAVAIGLVLAEHTGLELFDGGNSGVIIFFVLSGFLITKLMLEEWRTTGTLNVGAFYGRRFVRIMPAPLVLAVVLLAASWHIWPDPTARRLLWFETFLMVTYLYNMRPVLFGDSTLFGAGSYSSGTGMLAHTWSLAVEEHFYLVWPWLVRCLRLPARDPINMFHGLMAFGAVIAVARFILDRMIDPDLVSIPLLIFDGFAFGAALAFMIHHGLWPRALAWLQASWVAPAACLLLLIDLVGRNQKEDGVDYAYWYITYIALAAFVLIGALYLGDGRGWVHRLLGWAPVVYIGKLSYSLYLWHLPVQVYFSQERFPEWSKIQIVAVEQVVTAAAALASYYGIERSARRLRRWFVVKPASPGPGGSRPGAVPAPSAPVPSPGRSGAPRPRAGSGRP